LSDYTVRDISTGILFDIQFLMQGELIALRMHLMDLLFIVIIYDAQCNQIIYLAGMKFGGN
jgi:hypothetical protein